MMNTEIVNNKVKLCALRLKELRTSKGMTLADFAHIAGTSASTIKRYEDGERVPNLSFLEKVSKKHLVPLEWLTGGEQKNDKEEEMLSIFRQLATGEQRALIIYAKFLLQDKENKN